MATLITDPFLEEQIQAERQASGGHHHDEVWDGVYMMIPLPNDEHQDLIGGLTAVLIEAIHRAGLGKVAVNFQLLFRDLQDSASREVCLTSKNPYPTHAM